MADDLRFERFDKARHKRELFRCGVPALDEYLRTSLNQQAKRGVTTGYVLAGPDGRIAGFFTLAAGRLSVASPPGHGFPSRMPLPTILVGRLAVDREFQSRGLGAMLLVHALRLAAEAAETIGAAVIEVDAKDGAARAFYAKHGFQSLPDDPLHMYLPMDVARALAARRA